MIVMPLAGKVWADTCVQRNMNVGRLVYNEKVLHICYELEIASPSNCPLIIAGLYHLG
jgi:hypothetical protein